MLALSKEKVLLTLSNYEKIMDRVYEVAGEIGFISNEYDTLDAEKTEFDGDSIHVIVYDSHYDLYDSIACSFPLDFLFEDEASHKDWYKNKRIEREQKRKQMEEQRQREQELAELQRLKEKYEKV
jgi:hypothetical protein